VLAFLGGGTAAWAAYSFKTFPAPVAKSTIAELAVANDETYFLAYGNGDTTRSYVGHVSPAGETDVVRDFAPKEVAGLAAAPDGTLSVANSSPSGGTDAVYRFRPGGDLETLPVPRIKDPSIGGGRPLFTSIVACNNREVWLGPGTSGSSDVVKLGINGKARIYRRKGVTPDELACGPKGTVWFTALHAPTKQDRAGYLQIGRISASGKLRLFRLPTTGSGPKPLAGPIVQGAGGGAMWFGSYDRKIVRGRKEQDHNYVGRITPTGHIKLTRVSPKIANPNRNDLACMTVGPDRHIWIGFSGAGIARVGDTGKIEKVPHTGGDCSMVADLRGNLWFGHVNRVARLRP
jgi:streptogramin lyase